MDNEPSLMRTKIVVIITLVLIPLFVMAMPKPSGMVTDEAQVIDAPTKQALDSYLSSFRAQTGVEIAVVTVTSLEGLPIEDYAVKLFQTFGVGQKQKNNGLLFLVAPNDKKMRVEVGYGIEGAINDALAGRILDTYVIPFFKKNDFSEGIKNGTIALVQTIVAREQLSFDPDQKFSVTKPKQDGLGFFGKLLVLLILGYLFIRHPWLLLFFLSSGRGGGSGGGGSFGGGFGGFGGGISGGGGASRGW